VLAERVLKQFPDDEAARYRMAFRALTGRPPDATEASTLARLFAEERELFGRQDADAARFLSVGESTWDKTLPAAALAAMTTVVSAIMNLDEFVVVR
jgi:hypothetical protein